MKLTAKNDVNADAGPLTEPPALRARDMVRRDEEGKRVQGEKGEKITVVE